tara:strand:- start:6 stop:257 length:252 start_codon:yes stop_codon:yes gene_type:complete
MSNHEINSATPSHIEQEAIDHASSKRWLERFPPSLTIAGFFNYAFSGQPTRAHSIAQSEAGQRILEAGMLTDHGITALQRCSR